MRTDAVCTRAAAACPPGLRMLAAAQDEGTPPAAPYETVKDEPGSDGDGAQWSSGRACVGCVRVRLWCSGGAQDQRVCAKPPGICDCFSDCRNCIVAAIPGLNFFSLGQVLCRPVPRL